LGEPLKGADKTVMRLEAAGFLLLPPCMGKGMKLLIFNVSLYDDRRDGKT
jgi:hypothetical protein